LATAFSISFKNFVSAFFIVCLLAVGQVFLITLLDSGRDTSQAHAHHGCRQHGHPTEHHVP